MRKNWLAYCGLRLSMLAIIAVMANALYVHFLYEDDIKSFNPTLNNLRKNADDASILYFGESSNFHLEHPDSPKIRISDYVHQLLPNENVLPVDNAGLNATNYLAVMRNLPETSKVHTLIVTMNLRSFGYTWILDGNYNFSNRSNAFAKVRPPLINRFFIALKAYDHLSTEERQNELRKHKMQDSLKWPFPFPYNTLNEWASAIADGYWLRDDRKGWNMEKIKLGSHYVKNFGFQLTSNENPIVQAFDDITAFAQERNLRVVFHLLPENMADGVRNTHEAFSWLLWHNREFLVDRYHNGNNVLVVDNLQRVHDTMFLDRQFPIEHFVSKGKELCAKSITDSMHNVWGMSLLKP